MAIHTTCTFLHESKYEHDCAMWTRATVTNLFQSRLCFSNTSHPWQEDILWLHYLGVSHRLPCLAEPYAHLCSGLQVCFQHQFTTTKHKVWLTMFSGNMCQVVVTTFFIGDYVFWTWVTIWMLVETLACTIRYPVCRYALSMRQQTWGKRRSKLGSNRSLPSWMYELDLFVFLPAFEDVLLCAERMTSDL